MHRTAHSCRRPPERGTGLKTLSLATLLTRAARALWVTCALSCATGAHATWTHTVDVLGGSPTARSFDRAIASNVAAALDLWTRHLAGGAAIEVEIELTDHVALAGGHSLTSGFVRHDGDREVYEQGVAYEIRTGMDPNGAAADLRIQLNSDYVANELWFDPKPKQRGTIVPVALRNVRKGGTVALAGIHMSRVPAMDYEPCLFHEKTLRSVEANTRIDGAELLAEAAAAGIRPRVTTFPLAQANEALVRLADDRIDGSGVLVVAP